MVPKLSNDHKPGSVTESVFAAADPQPVHEDVLVTVAPFKCVVAVVPLAPLPIPVNLVPLIPV